MPTQDQSDSAEWDALARHVAGESSPDEADVERRALMKDPQRAALLAALDDAVRSDDPAPPSSADVESALARVRARRDAAGESSQAPVVPIERYRSAWKVPRYAAAAALLLVVAGTVWRANRFGRFDRVAATPPVQFSTPAGVLDTVMLSDGSTVLLGPGSRITLGPGFGTGTRELTLDGEARFDVVHDESRPFLVWAGVAKFRDVGTVFAVRSDVANGARLVVSEGAVAVESNASAPPITIRAGDRAVVSPSGAVLVHRASAGADDVAWTSGRLVFRDASLTQVAEDVRRWYGLDLRIDSALASQRLNVSFDRTSGPDVARTIAAMIGGTVREDGRIIAITRGRTSPSR